MKEKQNLFGTKRSAVKRNPSTASNVIKLAAMPMVAQEKERVHPEVGAQVQQKGHDEKADQRNCKRRLFKEED